MLVCRALIFDGSNMSLLLPRTRYLLCTLLLAWLSLNSATAAPTPGDQDLIRDRQNRLLDDIAQKAGLVGVSLIQRLEVSGWLSRYV